MIAGLQEEIDRLVAETGGSAAAAAALVMSDPWLAHQTFFPHRHPVASAEFHAALVADFWSPAPESICLAFRGSGKSTLGEEDIALAAAWRVYRNILIIGSSETRAAERLASISYELTTNDALIEVFGPQKGMGAWTQTKLVTAGNICIQAMGRDQDIRGIKYLEWRPDFVFVDDFEDKDTVQSPEGRIKTLRWFLGELLPACAPERKIRVRATPMDAESVPMRLINESRWPAKIYPIEYLDDDGRTVPAWPRLFSEEWIARTRRTYESLGELMVWNREYLCRAFSDLDRTFKREMLQVEHRVRTWEPVYAMIDPARSVRSTSASTGWAVWSWVNNRLIVWAAGAPMLLPDQIIDLLFDIAERFDPIWIGVEEDGLSQFLLQPIRQAQIRRGETIPYRGVAAITGTRGLGKIEFIRSLQPFFENREVVFAQPLADLESQLLNFPTGRIDAPNALAYALRMRPAMPIYENFTPDHIVEAVEIIPGRPLHLAANATGGVTTAALMQIADGRIAVIADWVREGSPLDCVAGIAEEAMLAAEGLRTERHVERPRVWQDMLKAAVPDSYVTSRVAPSWSAPRQHFERYMNVGLAQAVRALPAELRQGGEGVMGQLYLKEALSRQVRGLPAVSVAQSARWTLRALAGGYTRAMVRGRLQEYAEEGPYRVLMEGLESFLGLMRVLDSAEEEDDSEPNYSFDRQGRRYLSAMPARDRSSR